MVDDRRELNAKEKIEDEEVQFYNLGPTEIDENSVYLKALDYAMEDNNVQNIAITGKNGSGKSSIIKTYENLHPEHKYINLSLASFNNNKQNNNQIERSILEQLFYTVNSNKIPYSRFRRIKNVKKKNISNEILKILTILVVLIISIYLLANPLKGNVQKITENYFSSLEYGIVTIILLIVTVASSGYIIYKICEKLLKTIEMSNIKLKKENIEIDGRIDQGSVLDKYLDEIIYFFETTKYDTVVIEDLDRFENSTEIFIKLRGLNKVINDCQTINKKVKFIYATRDDIFNGEERTKFFDFIIPVIPVISATNSIEQMINKLKENDLEYSLDLDYIRDISLYIEDIRILNNIINEFNIYRQTIDISNLIQEKLFSIILLKNLYPKEFANLQKRKGIVFNIFDNKYGRLTKCKIEDKDIQTLAEEGIATLIDKYGIENILTEEERQNELITYLIVNEYIDEDYNEYINYFYEGTLKKEDKEFIMAVKTKREMPYNYELTKIKEILNNLPMKYFAEKYILNFSLVDYILEDKEKYNEQIKRLFSQMKNNNDETIEFCTRYIERGRNVKIFIEEMCKYWQDMWNYIHFNSNEEMKKAYLYNIVKYADKAMIERINELGLLKEAIIEQAGFIGMFEDKEEAKLAQKVIEALKIKFENLNGEDIRSPLGEYIINNNCYIINETTINMILRSKYNVSDKNIESKNYSSIIQTNNNAMIGYINENIEEYINNVFLKENTTINDNEEDIIKLLNNEELSMDIREEIIRHLELKITKIGDIDAKLWKTLLINNKVDPSWNNVIEYYYEKEELGKELIEYINTNSKELSKIKIDDADIFAEDVQQEFCDDVIKEENITEDIIESLTSFNIDEEMLKSNLNNNRVRKMIEKEMVPVGASTYNLVRENYKELLPNYVALKPSFFVEMQENLEYDKKDLKGILLNKNTSKDAKTDIIMKIGDKIPCDNEEEANVYYDLISTNNKKNAISMKLFKKMIKYLDEEKALKLIISRSKELDEKNITECLRLIGEPYNGITTKAIPKIKKTKLTEELMEMLVKKDISYISSILENKGYYTVYKTRK